MRLDEIPDLSMQPGQLVPLDPVRGKESSLEGVSVGIGGPLIFPYSADNEDDPELKAFMAADTEWAYFTLRLRCTFEAPNPTRFTEASVRFNLARADGSLDHAPMGWDAIPERATSDEGTRTTTRSLSAKACVKGIDLGPEASVVVEKKQEDVFAQVFGLLGPKPRWKLRRTPSHALEGDQELALVVRVPRMPVVADLDLRAHVQQRYLGIVPYRVQLPPQSARVNLN